MKSATITSFGAFTSTSIDHTTARALIAGVEMMKKVAAALYALLALGVISGGVAGQSTATTNEPSRQPILRLETGMHTAHIDSIGVDAAGRYLVTASVDKTARVWELATGRLLRTLRPPIGEGNEG